MKGRSAIASCGFLAAVTAGISVDLQANEYSFGYSVEAGYEYDDNVRLTPEDELDISGARVSIPATLRSRSERLDASLIGELVFSRFDEDAYDSDDQNLRAEGTYTLERGEVEGYAGYRRDSTRTSEFLDTGAVGLEASRREVASVGLSGDNLFTERNGLTGGIDYRDVNYETDLLQDYQFVSGYGGWLHQWSEHTRLRFQGYASYFDNEGRIEVQTDTVGVQVGFDSRLTENLTTSLLVGWANLDTDYSSSVVVAPEDDEASKPLLSASINYKQERYRLGARLRSEPRPSGNGVVVSDHLLDIDYRYRVTERSGLEVKFTAGQRAAVDDRIENERDFARVSMRVDYQLTSAWYIAGTYQYSYQDRELATDSADSNAIYFSVLYKPLESVWSR